MDKSPSTNQTSGSLKWLWIGIGAVVLIALAVLLITQLGGAGGSGGAGGGIY